MQKEYDRPLTGSFIEKAYLKEGGVNGGHPQRHSIFVPNGIDAAIRMHFTAAIA
jgi:hypothetical protein